MKGHEVYMFAPYMCFGMKEVLSLCTGLVCPVKAVINEGLIIEDSVGGRGVLGLAPPSTEIPISLKHDGTDVPTTTSLQ